MTIENSNGMFLITVSKAQQAVDISNISILFDYIQDETSAVDADITDNWVESNYSIQDHIAVKPRIYRLRGCVGEVVYEDTSRIMKLLRDADKENHPLLKKTLNLLDNPTPAMDTANAVLTGLNSLSGVVSNYTRMAMNVAKQIDSSYDRYYRMWKNFRNENQFFNNKRQKYVYAILQQMLQNRIPVKLTDLMFDVEGLLKANEYDKIYYIQSVSAHQGETEYLSDIEITIKEFRIATTKTTKVDKSKNAGITATAKTVEADNGSAKGNPVPKEKAKEVLVQTEQNLKAKTKETLQGHPVAYNLVKGLYFGIKKIGELGTFGGSGVGFH